MKNIVELLLNHYTGGNFHPSRQVKFIITEDCLKDCLNDIEDERSVNEFMDSYDSDDSALIYQYAAAGGRILSEDVTYCDAFEKDYSDFIKAKQMTNPEMTTAQMATKEDYYWTTYIVQRTYSRKKNNDDIHAVSNDNKRKRKQWAMLPGTRLQ